MALSHISKIGRRPIRRWRKDPNYRVLPQRSSPRAGPDPLTTTDDGSGTAPYTGADAGQITLGGELNKLAANVGFGRVFSGIHWRQDIVQGMLLGETVAIGLLRDQGHLYNENYTGFTFTKFDGTKITV